MKLSSSDRRDSLRGEVGPYSESSLEVSVASVSERKPSTIKTITIS